MTKVLKSAKFNMFSQYANFVGEIWFSRDRNESIFKTFSAKKYEDNWNHKPIINLNNEGTKRKKKTLLF